MGSWSRIWALQAMLGACLPYIWQELLDLNHCRSGGRQLRKSPHLCFWNLSSWNKSSEEWGATSPSWIGRGISLSLLSRHQLVFLREEMFVIPWDSITYSILHEQPVSVSGAKSGCLPLNGLTSVDLSFLSSSWKLFSRSAASNIW